MPRARSRARGLRCNRRPLPSVGRDRHYSAAIASDTKRFALPAPPRVLSPAGLSGHVRQHSMPGRRGELARVRACNCLRHHAWIVCGFEPRDIERHGRQVPARAQSTSAIWLPGGVSTNMNAGDTMLKHEIAPSWKNVRRLWKRCDNRLKPIQVASASGGISTVIVIVTNRFT